MVVADLGFVTCPSCHTVDGGMTNAALGAGADWHCGRCGQRWDALRLATAAAYAEWVNAHAAVPAGLPPRV